MSLFSSFALMVLIIGVSATFPNVDARLRRRYQEDQQSQDLSQTQQLPDLQTKPFYFDQNQQRPHKPQQKPLPIPISQNQQSPEEQGQLFQNQQRPQVQPSRQTQTDDLSDENDLQQTSLLQQFEQGLDKGGQQQLEQDLDKYEKELVSQSQQNGHKGQVTEEDAQIVDKKDEKKPWYIRLKNWGEKKVNQIG